MSQGAGKSSDHAEAPPALPAVKETGRRRPWSVPDLLAVAALAGYAVLKAYALSPALSDENIYFYMCRRIAEGLLPYRDFFFAHPPLHLLPGSLVMGLFGFSLPVAKALPALAAGLAGVAIYRAGRRASPLQGLISLGLFLFAYDMLRASSHYTGAAEATALIAWALERALARRPAMAGLLAGAAGMTTFYSVPAAAALGLWIFLRGEEGPRAARRYALGFSALFAGLNLLFAGLFQADYWDPVFRYHFMKPPAGAGNLPSTLAAIARENPWIIWGGPAAIATFALGGAGRPGRRRRETLPARVARTLEDPVWGPALAGLLMAGLHLLFFTLLTRVYTFYVLPAFPGLALAGGAAYRTAGSRALSLAGRGAELSRGAGSRAGPGRMAATLVVLALLAATLAPPLLLPSIFPIGGIDAEEGELLRSYSWKDSPLPDWLDSAVKWTVWKDDRIQGEWPSAATRYLWHESRHFTAPGDLAARVRDLVPEEGTLFGDSVSAPLVALLAGRRITGEHADTNAMRYRSRITPPEEAIARLEEDLPWVVVANPRRGFLLVPEMKAWVTSRYRIAHTFRDPLYGTYHLYVPGRPPE